MRVLALVRYPFDTVGSQRYRIEQWQPELARLGVHVDLNHLIEAPASMAGLHRRPPQVSSFLALGAGTVRRVRDALARNLPDVVLLHREACMVGPPLIEALIAQRVPLVFDLDDAIWQTANGLPWWSPINLIRMPAKTGWIMRISAAVSAGNNYIAQYASRYAQRIEIVPSTIDTTGMYKHVKTHSTSEVLVVGWTGSRSTAPYLERVLPALAAATAEVPIRLLVIGAEVTHPKLDIECRPWQSKTEVKDLQAMDVGLMPLTDDKWSHGKCGMKALQYMALGIPAVVSPIGVNTEIVTDGENGVLAREPRDWGRALRKLKDPTTRNRLGKAARRTVEERYSASVGAAKLARLLKAVVGDTTR